MTRVRPSAAVRRGTIVPVLLVGAAVVLASCGSDSEHGTPTNLDHDVATLQQEVDHVLIDVDEVKTIDDVSADMLNG